MNLAQRSCSTSGSGRPCSTGVCVCARCACCCAAFHYIVVERSHVLCEEILLYGYWGTLFTPTWRLMPVTAAFDIKRQGLGFQTTTLCLPDPRCWHEPLEDWAEQTQLSAGNVVESS